MKPSVREINSAGQRISGRQSRTSAVNVTRLKATDVAGTVAVVGGLSTAAMSHDRTAQQVGLGIALAGLVTKIVSAAATPQADIRSWDNLPRYLSFACLELPPGQHAVTVEFRGPNGFVIANFTKTATFEVPANGKDKVIFIGDQSVTPQTL